MNLAWKLKFGLLYKDLPRSRFSGLRSLWIRIKEVISFKKHFQEKFLFWYLVETCKWCPYCGDIPEHWRHKQHRIVLLSRQTNLEINHKKGLVHSYKWWERSKMFFYPLSYYSVYISQSSVRYESKMDWGQSSLHIVAPSQKNLQKRGMNNLCNLIQNTFSSSAPFSFYILLLSLRILFVWFFRCASISRLYPCERVSK